MVNIKCDGCGTLVNPDSGGADPSIYFFTQFEFCPSCYNKLQDAWMNEFRKCGHDMSNYLPQSVEVAKVFTGRVTSKKTVAPAAIKTEAPKAKTAGVRRRKK